MYDHNFFLQLCPLSKNIDILIRGVLGDLWGWFVRKDNGIVGSGSLL